LMIKNSPLLNNGASPANPQHYPNVAIKTKIASKHSHSLQQVGG
jgi:hypothetical protein